MSHIEKLLELAGPPLGRVDGHLEAPLQALGGRLANDLERLLQARNGFYVFESALHVLPTHGVGAEIGIHRWNAEDLWKDAYSGMARDLLCFSEDLFGGQFCIKRDDGVHMFEPETGSLERLSDDLEGWAERVLDEYETLTGYPVAHEWQARHGPLGAGQRLIPKIPFVVGGEFTVENLYNAEAARAMRLRGSIATQIRDLPDGAEITFGVTE